MTVNPDRLSDAELRSTLQRLGCEVGPITDSTRHLYKQRLKKRMRDEITGETVATKRRRVEDSPSLPRKTRVKQRGRSRSPRYYNSPLSSSTHQSNLIDRHPQSHTPDPEPELPRHKQHIRSSPNYSLRIDDHHLEEDPDGMGTSLTEHGMGTSLTEHGKGMSLTEGMDINPHHDYNIDPIENENPPLDRSRSPSYRRQPLRRRLSSESSFGVDNTFSTTARWIGKGFKEGLKSVVNLIQDVVSPLNEGPSRNFSYARRQDSIPLDSVEIGGEVEIGENTENRIELSPLPSAPPPPNEYSQSDVVYDWELLPSDVQICLRPDGSKYYLGKGGFGEVFKGIKDGVDEVAVKVIKLQHTTSISQFKSEIDMISRLRHRHILQFYGACIKPLYLYMVTELMQNDLFNALRKDQSYTWAGTHGREVCRGIISGLHYLHSRRPPVVHRDIKSPNILLLDGVAKIADVGIARTKMQSDMTAQRGYTIAWAAPEVIYRRRATEKIDIWSFGIILWEIVTGQLPNPGRLVLPESSGQDLQRLYLQCTNENPSIRPSAADILITLRNIK